MKNRDYKKFKNDDAFNTRFVSVIIVALIFTISFTSCEDDVVDDSITDNNATQELSGDYDDDLHLENIHDDPNVADYIVTGDVEINARLTIDPGVRIEFEEDLELRINSSGIVEATGTEDDKIIFTTADLEGGKFWKGIFVRSSDVRNKIEFVTVEYAGNSSMSLGPFSSQNRQTNIGIDDDATLSILNSKISNSKGYGVFARGTIYEHIENSYTDNLEGALSAHVSNAGIFDKVSVYSGNRYDGIEIHGGTIEQEITWSILSRGAAYKISDDIEVEAPLYITEGVTLELDEDVLIIIQEGSSGSSIDGYIDISGTENLPVTFTTSNLAGGQHWKGIRVNTSDIRNKMDNVIIEYGGNSNMGIGPFSSQNRQANVGVDENASLTITNAIIRHSKAWGIAAIESANLTLENVQYDNNPEGNITDNI